jgi:sugar-specific transcriptional regulator TrmB
MIPEKYIETLTELELSPLQAKTYLNLARLGKADVNTISKASNLARTDAYRVMIVLEKLGLAEKIIAKKTEYQATPIKEGISILLQNKRRKYAKVKRKTASLLRSIHDNDLQDFKEENQQFIITSEPRLFQKRFGKSLSEAKTCDMMIPAAGLKYTLFYFRQFMKTALKKGAEIRIITEKPEDAATYKKMRHFEKNSFFEIRFAAVSHMNFAVTIFNGKEMNLCISRNSEVPSLYSNNAQAVEEAKMLFEATWNNSEVHNGVYSKPNC